MVKKVAKDIMKLFSKKACMDISEGGKIKKHAKESVSTEAIVQRFQSLPYNDQHAVGASVACQLLEIMNGFSTGSSNYLPLVSLQAKKSRSGPFPSVALGMTVPSFSSHCRSVFRLNTSRSCSV